MNQESGDAVESTSPTQPSSIQCSSKGTRLTSSVWNDLKREVADNGEVTTVCNRYKKPFKASHKHGTTHLSRHIQNCSARIYRMRKNSFISGSECSESVIEKNQMSLRKPTASLEEIREALCIFVISGGHPFSIVEEPGFKNMMRITSPDFHLVSRYTIKRDAMNRYKEEKKVVGLELQNAPGRISFTTDNWRSEEVLISLAEWKIGAKVFTFTLDNASYNDTMIASLKKNLLRKHFLVLHGEFIQMRCCCHIINLVVQAGLKLIDEVVVKIIKVIIHLRHSIPKKKKFYEIATTNFGLSHTKRLRLDTHTRWNSTFTMLDRFLYFQETIDCFVGKDLELREHRLTENEWGKVSELHTFLQVFYDVTNEFSTSKTPTTNLYFQGVWSIHMHLKGIADGPPSILSDMVIPMQEKFEKYWSEYNLMLSCAAVLDPRFKLEGVSFCYSEVYGNEDAQGMMDDLKKLLLELIDEYKSVGFTMESSESNESEILSKDTSSSDSSVRRVPFALRAKMFDHLSKRPKTTSIKSELEVYLEDEDNTDFNDDLDILAYWKVKARKFPALAALARDVLSIPISSVPSKSAFSLGKKMITSSRSSLASSTIEALSCYEDWLRVRGFCSGPSKILKIGDEGAEDMEDEDESSEMV